MMMTTTIRYRWAHPCQTVAPHSRCYHCWLGLRKGWLVVVVNSPAAHRRSSNLNLMKRSLRCCTCLSHCRLLVSLVRHGRAGVVQEVAEKLKIRINLWFIFNTWQLTIIGLSPPGLSPWIFFWFCITRCMNRWCCSSFASQGRQMTLGRGS